MTMPSPDEFPMPERSMSPPPPIPARSIANFFTRALSSFRSSAIKLQVICTADASPHHGGLDDGEPAPLPPRVRPRTLIVLDSSFNPPTRAHLRMATSAIHALTHKQGQGPGALRLLLLLSVNNADKGTKPAAFDKRLAMMWAFARDVQHQLQTAPGNGQAGSGAEVLSVDLGLATAPYFHEKSAALVESGFYNGEKNTGGVAEMEQVYLVGYDTLIRIFNPKYYGPLESTRQVSTAGSPPMQRALGPFFARAKLRVTMRTGDEWGGADEQTVYLQDLMRAEGLSKVGGSTDWGGRIEMVEEREVGADIISSTYARAAAKDGDSGRLDSMVTPEVRWWIEQGDLYAE